MFNISGGKFAVILVIAMIVLGPDKLPSAARQVGQFLRRFHEIRANLEAELRNAVTLAEHTPPPDDEPDDHPT